MSKSKQPTLEAIPAEPTVIQKAIADASDMIREASRERFPRTRFPGEERCAQDSQSLRPVHTRWERVHDGKKCLVEVVKHVYDRGSYSWSERVELVQE